MPRSFLDLMNNAQTNQGGTVRLPDGDLTLADLASVQTLTNKTLTSPTVVGGSVTGITNTNGLFISPTLTNPIVDTIVDTLGVTRLIVNPTPKTIVDGSATSMFSVAVPAGLAIGGFANFLVVASDGTDIQTISGAIRYSAVAKLTAVTANIMDASAADSKSVSAGTLTLSFTADVSVNNVVTFKVQPTGSLTETTYYITYALYPIAGVVTIL